MLVLSRQSDESIIIDNNITVKVLEVSGDTVKIGIDAPRSIPVYRKELYDAITEENISATRNQFDGLDEFTRLFNRESAIQTGNE